MSQEPYGAKAAAREELQARRREGVPGRDRARDAQALARAALQLVHEVGLAPDGWVATYESLPSEPPTEAMIEQLSAQGLRVMVPITRPDWDLDWREHGTETALGLEAIGQARVVFVPAQAVDASGTRLGRGRGCYDRALPRTDALVVAVVHPWEVLDRPLPAEPHDRRMDASITADGVRRLEVGRLAR